MGKMKVRIFTALDKGNRENNEDALVYCPNLCQAEWLHDGMDGYVPLESCGAIAVVADGMGGASAGEVASDIAIATVQKVCTPERAAAAVKGGDDTIKSLLAETIKQADMAIQERMATDTETQGMGTTIVLCWVVDGKAQIAWCGDSRCYCYNPAKGLLPLTHDHSLVQEMIDKGELSVEEAFTHPDSNIITRGLGDFVVNIEPDIVAYPIRSGDTLLLCSDGLCGYCFDEDIEQIMDETQTDTAGCCQGLMKLSLDVGGNDNIGIVAMSIIDDNQTSPSPLTKFQTIVRQLKRVF